MGPDDAERMVDAMARARELLGFDIEPPSRELQSWYAIVETERGTITERVQTTWEDAWRATGLLD
jgi:hypothetical protein